jgi:hypothetical protein
MVDSVRVWAQHEFGAADLGDARRKRRLLEMAESAARRPAGKVSAVFTRSKDREGAYDFLESPHAPQAAFAESMFKCTAERTRGEKVVYVPIDLTALSLTDIDGEKFGPVGSPNRPVRGLMVANAMAVTTHGVPMGLIDQQYWMRDETEVMTKNARTERNQNRPFEDKQGTRFTSAAENAVRRLGAVGVVPWVIIDREGDNRGIILRLANMACAFTVRASWNRSVGKYRSSWKLRDELEAQPSLCATQVELPRNGARRARTAVLEVRAVRANVRFDRDDERASLELFAVLVQEKGRRRDAKAPLDWLLYTNLPVTDAEGALKIIAAYRARWRIEEFHRTWKSGACNIETTQLRSFEAVAKWATILSAVSTRIERLKYLARNDPSLPATAELEAIEVEALLAERRSRTDRRVRLPRVPTIGDATNWIAEMGGWMGQKTSGPPGSTTIARGLQVLAVYTRALVDLRRGDARPHPRGVKEESIG